MRRILDAPDASANDRFVAEAVLRNAVIAAEGVLPLCQDTGSIQIFAGRGHRVVTGGQDEDVLAAAASEVYRTRNLRYSIMAPLTVMDEVNTGDEPAGPGRHPGRRRPGVRVLLRGQGRRLVQQDRPLPGIQGRAGGRGARDLPGGEDPGPGGRGLSALPHRRRRRGIVAGDDPQDRQAGLGRVSRRPARKGGKRGDAFRDPGWEERIMRLARETGLGAQFGGLYLAHEARFVRLPRHAGSCPIGLGVSCNADRGLRGKITADGVFLEEVERHPVRFLEGRRPRGWPSPWPSISTSRWTEILAKLKALPVGTMVRLSGPLVVARDIAHARLARMLRESGDVPDYLKRHPGLLRRPGQDAEGHGLRQLRTDDGPAHGRLHGRLPEGRGLVGDARQGQPDRDGGRGSEGRGRGVPGHDRRSGGPHRQGAHRLERDDRFRRFGDGGDPEDRGQGPARLRHLRREGRRPLRYFFSAVFLKNSWTWGKSFGADS
ncbi:MAG: fumarate hydratase [Candidatus Moduliflexus flocculans]|nr:fumarate hydratase [Candidatus Moduliflexus flocculans]